MAKHTQSAEVIKMERLIEAIEKGVDPKAGQTGCFCMGAPTTFQPNPTWRRKGPDALIQRGSTTSPCILPCVTSAV